MNDQELIELNLKVAAIAGWKDIKQLFTNLNQEVQPKEKMYVGKNDRKALGKLIPDYVHDLNEITALLNQLGCEWSLCSGGGAYATSGSELVCESYGETPAIALCKLLVELHPEPKIQIIDDDGGDI